MASTLNRSSPAPGPSGARRGLPSQFRDFNEVTKGAEKIEGLFTLYKTGDHLYGEIRPDQFNQTLLVPVTIARGLAQAGHPVGDDEMVADFQASRRSRPARPAQHSLQGTGRPVARKGRQAELHRFGLDGTADHRAQSDDGGRRLDRLFRYLHDRFRRSSDWECSTAAEVAGPRSKDSPTTWSWRSRPPSRGGGHRRISWAARTASPTTAASRW